MAAAFWASEKPSADWKTMVPVVPAPWPPKSFSSRSKTGPALHVGQVELGLEVAADGAAQRAADDEHQQPGHDHDTTTAVAPATETSEHCTTSGGIRSTDRSGGDR